MTGSPLPANIFTKGSGGDDTCDKCRESNSFKRSKVNFLSEMIIRWGSQITPIPRKKWRFLESLIFNSLSRYSSKAINSTLLLSVSRISFTYKATIEIEIAYFLKNRE